MSMGVWLNLIYWLRSFIQIYSCVVVAIIYIAIFLFKQSGLHAIASRIVQCSAEIEAGIPLIRIRVVGQELINYHIIF